MPEWTPDLLLNHDLLDEDHMEIFRRIADATAVLDGPTAGVEKAVAALADALVTHLATEERLMEESLYPERARHRSAHELFMADFLQMRDELREKGPTPLVADWIQRRIPEWLRFHVRVNDLPFGLYLSRRRAAHPETRGASKDRPRRLS
jgi:hemerythrin-like metal-binding protein